MGKTQTKTNIEKEGEREQPKIDTNCHRLYIIPNESICGGVLKTF